MPNDNHSWTLSIPMVPPSGNVLLRQFWTDRQKLIDCWHETVWALCNEARVPPADHMLVESTIHFRDNRRRDPQNYVPSIDKLVFDGLSRCGIIPDDSPAHLTWSVPILEVDSKNPRTEVFLTIL